MASQLAPLLSQLRNPSLPYETATSLLSKAKITLLQHKSLTPTPASSSDLLPLARETLELGALHSIRAAPTHGDAAIPAFIRYVQQLGPFYETDGQPSEQRNKITGLYLLLLLTQGRYAEFHSELERIGSGSETEGDRYLGYPIRLERWLMEGSYDRIWNAIKMGEVPCEEFGVFSEILTSQIRSEIATSSEKAYPSLPISSTKSLLFLESEGAVISFAHSRGWTIKDGHIYFPAAGQDAGEEPEQEVSQMVIENTLGYARQLETIV